MTAPLVSCIIPAFNGARHIGEAIGSILRQTHAAIEVIVVDDGSTDETPATLMAFGERITVLQQANAGPAAARNTGVAAARGPFVAFLDQDDRWPAHKLARQLARFEARPELDVVVSHVESYWDQASGSGTRLPDQPRAGVAPGYVTSTMLARRAIFDRVGPFDPGLWYVDSLEWFLRARERGAIVELMPDALLDHRVHGGNLSRRGEASRAECLRVLRGAIERRRAGQSPT